MEKQNNNRYKDIYDKLKLINSELFEESKLKHPEYHVLEKSASQIINLLKITEEDDDEFKNWAMYNKQDMDIFKSDLVGELYHDYNNRLVRYYNKWENQRQIIERFISDFKTRFGSRII